MKKLLAAALAVLLIPACGDEGDTIVQGGPTPPPSGSLLMTTQNGLLLVVQPGSPPTILGAVGLAGVSASGGSTVVYGIDHRVQDGFLYGVVIGNAYRIDPLTGVCLQIANYGLVEGTAFDPVTGLLRIAGVGEENATLDVTSNTLDLDPDLAYGPTDPHFGLNPAIQEVACSNQAAGAASTTLYGIDRTNNILVTIAPSTGVMTTVGPLGVDVQGPWSPFDISAGGAAYLVDQQILYTVDLATGLLTALGPIPTTDTISGLAVVP